MNDYGCGAIPNKYIIIIIISITLDQVIQLFNYFGPSNRLTALLTTEFLHTRNHEYGFLGQYVLAQDFRKEQ